MKKPRNPSALDNQVRSRRQALGLSQQALARRCSLTRQAINAIEAGLYVPSTLVALRLARVFGCTVEDLFRLPEAFPRLEAEWLGARPVHASESTRVQVAWVGERLLAHPLTGAMAALTAADGLLVTPDEVSTRQVEVELLIEAQWPRNTVVVAGCDPALALLGSHLTRRYPALRLVWIPRSSLAALRMLARGEVHAAGTHLWEPESGESNLGSIQRELAGHAVLVVTLSRWQQGLIVTQGNPKGIVHAADLGRPDVLMVNRDSGSGSRALLDLWLQQANVAPPLVRGYGREVASHLAVAESVASGGADVGPGILSVARAFELAFVPLQEERYDLVIPLPFLNTPAVQALLDMLVNPRYQGELAALGGYDSTQAGTVVAELSGATSH
ncbi:MAG: substrate-binding domain-containing protein [Candidatus Tectimicrobiota bacterium]